jgi:SAM-dependent methyltransferase
MREGYSCPACDGSLRYQAQAQTLVRSLSRDGASSVAELAAEERFRSLAIYEPGTLGPFRDLLGPLPDYTTSAYWPDVDEGDDRDGLRCENLMHLTFDDGRFDLVITSDIFEHVRKPFDGFGEIRRVLRPGGIHVFSVPVAHPFPERSVARVDTSTDEDVMVLEPRFHNGHLVYTDFGRDLLGRLGEIGTPTETVRFDSPDPVLRRVITFRSRRTSERAT